MAAPNVSRQAWRQAARSSPSTAPSLAASCRHWSSQASRRPSPLPATAAASPSASARSSLLRSARAARRSYSSQPPKGSNNAVKFWPFAAIIVGGTGLFALTVTRKNDMPADTKQIGAPGKDTPTFSADDVTVVFVLGGPGAGKGTQCSNLVRDYGFTHLSAGDLLRAEQERPGSQFGDLIRDYIKNGQIVPMEVTIQLLENAMAEALDPSNSGKAAQGRKGKFLIDGFPRKFDQAVKFEESVCPARLVLFYDCPEAEMERRLLDRGKTSGRADDNADSIRKRFRTFIETSMPVVDYYEKQDKVIKIDSTPKPAVVYKQTQDQLSSRLGDRL